MKRLLLEFAAALLLAWFASSLDSRSEQVEVVEPAEASPPSLSIDSRDGTPQADTIKQPGRLS